MRGAARKGGPYRDPSFRAFLARHPNAPNEDILGEQDTGITAYLDNGGTLEYAQAIAAHKSPRTTKLYDRASDQITLDEIERIAI